MEPPKGKATVSVRQGQRLWAALKIALERGRKIKPQFRWDTLGVYESRIFPKDSETMAILVYSPTNGHIFMNGRAADEMLAQGMLIPWAVDILLHEFAHAMVADEHGPKVQPHGVEWRRLARELGCVPQARATDHERLRSYSCMIVEEGGKKNGVRFTLNGDTSGKSKPSGKSVGREETGSS